MAEIYVDPSINANSGSGTIGAPYGDLQYALDSTTQGALGDRFNIKAGTAEVLTGSLSLTTYGTPAYNKPLIFQGYTSTAGDGGRGVIDGAASYSIQAIANTASYTIWRDLRLTNTGSNDIIEPRAVTLFVRCEFDTSTGNGVDCSNQGRISAVNCYFHDIGASGKYVWLGGSGTGVFHCWFDAGSNSPTAMIRANWVVGNVVRCSGAIHGIHSMAGGVVINNSVYGGGGTGRGIFAVEQAALTLNNIVEGFSSGGGIGISGDYPQANGVSHNALYNNTTGVSGTFWMAVDNDTLGASAFVNAAGGDFDINGSVAGVTEDAWPTSWPGLTTATAPKADKGAVQAGAGSGGGGGLAYPVVGNSFIRGAT